MSLAQLIHRSRPATMANGLRLRPETPFERYPEVAIAVIPGTRLIQNDAIFEWADDFVAHLADLVYEPQVSPDGSTCDVLATADDAHSLRIQCTPNGAVTLQTEDVQLLVAGEVVDPNHALAGDPYRLFFGDGSSVRGFLISTPSPDVPAFPATNIDTLDWENVDISKETTTDIPDQQSIFEYMHEYLATRHPNSLIINDDGPGELADIIVLTDRGAHAEAMLFHCKGAPRRSERVDQLYAVVGQAQRSLRWVLNRAAFWTELERRGRERAAFRIIKDPAGVAADWLARSAEAAPVTTFQVAVVQPGLVRDALRQGRPANVLLSSCKASADSAGAQFALFCSA
jgi:hypothetical protein